MSLAAKRGVDGSDHDGDITTAQNTTIRMGDHQNRNEAEIFGQKIAPRLKNERRSFEDTPETIDHARHCRQQIDA
jgi:hypothetical protein